MDRRWINAFIGCWLLVQIVLPVSYYLGKDPTDERFSWRMFSARRMQPCEWSLSTRATPGASWQVVPLERYAHNAWADRLMRGQRGVVDRFLERLCADSSVSESRYSLSCRPLDGAPEQEETVRVCATGAMRRPEGR